MTSESFFFLKQVTKQGAQYKHWLKNVYYKIFTTTQNKFYLIRNGSHMIKQKPVLFLELLLAY